MNQFVEETEKQPATSLDVPPIRLQPGQLYQNFPLRPRAIRVLDVLPRDGIARLRGSLRVVDLDAEPSFAALSYVWGKSDSPSATVDCNDCNLPIPLNCGRALVYLRAIYGTITIWVDSICIDQGNDDEKASQIPLMEDIYASAHSMYIWLNPRPSFSDAAKTHLLQAASLRSDPVVGPWIGSGPLRKTRRQQIRNLVWIYFKALVFGEIDSDHDCLSILADTTRRLP